MTLQLIAYRGRVVACASPTRFFLCDELDRRLGADPERFFVSLMCAYAGEVLAGRLPGPYDDKQARALVRAALLPGELAERPGLDPVHLERALGLPAHEIRVEQRLLQLARRRGRTGALRRAA